MNTYTYTLNHDITLESGKTLKKPSIAFHTYGTLNEDKSNVVWVCHALTASSDVFSWWEGLVGPDEIINPKDHFIVCANILGSHYGTTSPLSIDPETQKPYFRDFPEYTIRDIVTFHKALASHLDIEEIYLLIGGSMGGHQALEWAIDEPSRIQNLVLLATSAVHSPWAVAFNESQRWAIENDPSWSESNPDAGINGMKAARSFALLSYRNFTTYKKSQQASSSELVFPDRAASYQRYQGEKLAKRFNAYSYWYLSKAMDSQNVGRGRGGIRKALAQVRAKTQIIAIKDDTLFPIEDQLVLEKHIPDSTLTRINSDYGHDGFLIEAKKLTEEIGWFMSICDSPIPESSQVQVGLLGFGVVGSQVYKQIKQQTHIHVRKIGIKHIEKEREAPSSLFTSQIEELLNDPAIEILIDAIDDAEVAYDFVKRALINGKAVISANKKMLAKHLQELNELSQKHNSPLFYEAAVAAAIPILQILNNYYENEPILKVRGIINGSTNYILHLMEEEQLDFDEALKRAQIKGFAESDPTLDIEAFDPAFKACLLAYSAFKIYADPSQCLRKGIDHITLDDIEEASKLDAKIKLVAEIKLNSDRTVSLEVGPQLVYKNDDLYNVDAENNGLIVEGKFSGLNLYKGKGAGGSATASAIMADLGLVIRSLKQDEVKAF